MPIALGILIEFGEGAGRVQPGAASELATVAEAGGLDLVVVSADRTGDIAGVDPWTATVWIAARTERIAVGVTHNAWGGGGRGAAFGIADDTPNPGDQLPSMRARALDSLEVLAMGRVAGVRAQQTEWRVAPREAGVAELLALTEDGATAVIRVSSTSEVRQASKLAAKMRAAAPTRRRSEAARSRRIAGIAYDDVPASLSYDSVEPGDSNYHSVSSTFFRGGAPGIVLRPTTPEQVVDAVAFARQHRGLALGIRSGGHGLSGRSTNRGGLVIDLGQLNEVTVLDEGRRLVRIGPGATWRRVAAELYPHGWALGSGDYGGVGVGGLATAGGIGLLSRKYGLTIDRLRAVELVLADGRCVRTSATEHPDLFWAMRGAGANFGIATAFEFEVENLVDVGWAKLVLTSENAEKALLDFGRSASAANRDTTAFLVTGAPRDRQTVVQLYVMIDSADPEVIVERLTPFAQLGTLVQQEVAVTSYSDVMAEAADPGPGGHRGFGEPVSRSAFLPALTPEFSRDAAELLESGVVAFFQLRAMGGAISDVSPDAMAFPHRTAAFQLTALGADDEALSAGWDRLRHHFDGLYLSFETDLRPERLLDAFPQPTLGRLRQLKRQYDPANLFRDNFNISPAGDAVDVEEGGSHDMEEAS